MLLNNLRNKRLMHWKDKRWRENKQVIYKKQAKNVDDVAQTKLKVVMFERGREGKLKQLREVIFRWVKI
jgi:hypothetical protein